MRQHSQAVSAKPSRVFRKGAGKGQAAGVKVLERRLDDWGRAFVPGYAPFGTDQMAVYRGNQKLLENLAFTIEPLHASVRLFMCGSGGGTDFSHH